MDKSVPRGRVHGTLTPPSSKSYAQRALAVSLLAGGVTVLRKLDFCQDTLSALGCIHTLGAEVVEVDASTLSIGGSLAPRERTLHVGESGLASRLFTPIAALHNQPIRIVGRGSLLERPMQMMIEPLRQLGATVKDNHGYLPFEVCGPLRGGEAKVDGSVSSQFITGLLLALPMAPIDTTLHVERAVSTPYLDMTIDTAARFGVDIFHRDYREFYIPGGQCYRGIDLTIEGDWSAAAMLLVAGAVAGEVRVENISALSKQADTAILDALARAGAEVIIEGDSITASQRDLHGFEFDATQCPDLFPALAALAAAAEGETTLYGTSRLTHKESNRAKTIAEEFQKIGIAVDISEENVMRIQGGRIHATEVESHNDHRIAMTLAVAGLMSDGEMRIHGAECVAKSYPDFFEQLESIRVK
ncbi:MAG: 3-phosphoshikimate 1-carboxyvinyltransferase [Alistipes sp.]|nr:3-phosphoshikimate 1-carboxyvinyltransferase [Alistipes sp.]